eukprot:TRINITY_DN464_c0_g1_i1.p1 TRINITY_DN464_c0_g1~~TRINITY_DN464_c0_g1_i1.p1  ORF type:complete len:194 (-),score=41.64 TRINITY_DN464_c0_g1_i1:129-710(-)
MGKGGKGKGSAKGSWVFVPAVKTSFRPAASSWGKSTGKSSKGAGKSGKSSWGKGKSGGKGGKSRKTFSDLSEERKAEIRAKHEEKQQELGRELADDTIYFGELVQRGKSYGWIKPSNFAKLPSDVQAKVKEMLKAKRQAVKQNNSTNEVFKQNVLFLHMSDVEEGVKVESGSRVKFKVYTDNEGAGAYEVTNA